MYYMFTHVYIFKKIYIFVNSSVMNLDENHQAYVGGLY